MNPFLKLIDTFSPDNHTRGVQFEKLCKWILENHPMYKSKLTKVWLWDDWPERWGRDCGIDLVAEDVDGNNWAIQAKCYDPKYSVTKQDIDSFLSESTNTKIQRRLLIATTDGLGSNAVGVIKRQHETTPINQLMLSDLLDAPIVWPKSLDDLSTGGVKKAYIPKPYQQIAIDKVTQNLDARGQLIMACGTGKTLTALWIAEALKSDTVLVLLPSLLLLSKTLAEWLTHSKEPFSYLPVCSDDTVAKSEDTIALSTSELSFPSTTDTDAIAKFLKSSGRKIIFSTYQSSPKIAEAFKAIHLKPLDLIIADEAHRCAGKVGSAYSTVLDNDQIPADKRLFMTATPKVYQAHFKKKAADSGVDVVSMDDHVVFGPVLHKLSFGEAIEQDLLTDYQVVVVGIDNPRYSEMITERSLVQTDNDIQSDAQSLASHIGLAKAMKTYDLKRVISFHSRVSAAKDFANKLPEVIDWMPEESRPDGELLTGYVSGAMPTNERSRNLRALGEIEAGQRYVLSNARCLSEGVDVPALDGVAFIDPRNSEIDIVQAVGRAIRLSKGKAMGSIVIPVFIEDHDDPDEVLNSSPFKKVWSVVNALRSHDGELGEQLDQLRQTLGKRGTVGRPDKILFDVPTTIAGDFATSLNTKLIESTTAPWEFWFGLLESYKEEFGDCLVKTLVPYRGYRLTNWVHMQRGQSKTLSLERKERLDNLGFVWRPDQEKWEEGFRYLAAYRNEFGDCLVNTELSYHNYNLGQWVSNQRSTPHRLKPQEKKRLDQLGFIWKVLTYQWEKGFDHLVTYQKEFGNCRVNSVDYHGYKLMSWVGTQRITKDKLDLKQVSRLNELGFVWKAHEETWEEGFKYLAAYQKEFGDCLITDKKTYQNFSLGTWVTTQRSKEDTLKPQQLTRLNKIGFIWNARDNLWEEGYKHLVAYKEEFGDCLVVIKSQYCGYKLGVWVSNQRVKKKTMALERVKRLNNIGFVWDLLELQWEEGFEYLIAYKEAYGNCAVLRSFKLNNYRLGGWVSRQRSNQDKLTPERFKRLDDLGFVWKVK
jgi:superfamily II DNA or RNA helicase